jgi:hypothetical protein
MRRDKTPSNNSSNTITMITTQLLSFKQELGSLLETVGHISLVFEQCRYDLITATLNHLDKTIGSETASIPVITEKIRHVRTLLSHLADINYSAGCNYIAERFEIILTPYLAENPSSDLTTLNSL